MKFLVLLLVIVVVGWLTFGRSARPGGQAGRTARRKPRAEVEEIVECAHCALNLPRSDAVLDGERAFCSEAHRLAGPRRE